MQISLVKKILQITLTLIISLFSYSSYADPTDGIEYYTENFPPYNFQQGNQAAGFNADLIVEMFKALNSKKTAVDIHVVPWARGYSLAKSSDLKVALFSTTRTKAREKLFKWVGPISFTTSSITTLKGNPKNVLVPLEYESGKFDPNFTYGAIRDDVGEQLLQSGGVPQKHVYSTSRIEQLGNMLKRGRIDGISYNPDVLFWLLKDKGFNVTEFEILFKRTLGEHYIAFNKTISDEVVQAHQKAIDKLTADKELMEKIKAKY
jgi:polar amino acid transport system substrate-binding protein